MAGRKVPLRRCIGCGESQSKKAMIRIIRTPEGTLEIDPRGKKSGRGCYVCPDESCVRAAFSGGKMAKALRVEDINPTDKEDLMTQLLVLLSKRV